MGHNVNFLELGLNVKRMMSRPVSGVLSTSEEGGRPSISAIYLGTVSKDPRAADIPCLILLQVGFT